MSVEKQVNKVGRPSQHAKWLEPDNLQLLEDWASEGLTNAEIAKHKMGISERTFYQWQTDNPQISQAIKKGRTFCILEVENALYRAAVGYEVEETVTETTTEETTGIKLFDDEEVKIRKRTQTRHVPPNVAAAIFYLKNRAPEQWRPDAKLNDGKSGANMGERQPMVINYNYGPAEPETLEKGMELTLDDDEPSDERE